MVDQGFSTVRRQAFLGFPFCLGTSIQRCTRASSDMPTDTKEQLDPKMRHSGRLRKPVTRLGGQPAKTSKPTPKPRKSSPRAVLTPPTSSSRTAEHSSLLIPACPICEMQIIDEDPEDHMLVCSKLSNEADDTFLSDGKRVESKETLPETSLADTGDVDIDGTDAAFGEAQFTEKDVWRVLSELQNNHSTSDKTLACESPLQLLCTLQSALQPRHLPRRIRLIVARLAIAIFYQANAAETSLRCSVCLESPKEPTVSTVCWHALCSACWLATIANKRVCPQCSSITQPGDLRRVFL